jgi:hypothetical protein
MVMNSESLSRRRIFETDFSVETISLYLLCMGLNDAGGAISTKNISEIWNGSKDGLLESLGILCGKNILKKILSDLEDEENAVYGLTEVDDWRL